MEATTPTRISSTWTQSPSPSIIHHPNQQQTPASPSPAASSYVQRSAAAYAQAAAKTPSPTTLHTPTNIATVPYPSKVYNSPPRTDSKQYHDPSSSPSHTRMEIPPTTTQPSSSRYKHTRAILKIVVIGDSGVGKTSLLHRFDVDTFTGQYKATIGADFCSKHVTLDIYPEETEEQQQGLETDKNPSIQRTRECTLQLWDTAGQERFQSLGTSFYRGADACILVYDVHDGMTFQHVDKWRRDFLKQVGLDDEIDTHVVHDRHFSDYQHPPISSPFPFILLGNKADTDISTSSFLDMSHDISSLPTMNQDSTSPTSMAIPDHVIQTWCIENKISFHALVSAKTGRNVHEAFLRTASYALQRQELQLVKEKNVGRIQFPFSSSSSTHYSPYSQNTSSSHSAFHLKNTTKNNHNTKSSVHESCC